MSAIQKYDPAAIERYNRLATTEQLHLARRIAMYLDTTEGESIPVELANDYDKLVKRGQEDMMEALILQERNEVEQVKTTVNNSSIHVHLTDSRPLVSDRGLSELLAGIVGIIFAFCTITFAGMLISTRPQPTQQPFQPRGIYHEQVK